MTGETKNLIDSYIHVYVVINIRIHGFLDSSISSVGYQFRGSGV